MDFKRRNKLMERRKKRVRKKIAGTAARPRLSLTFTNKHLYAQCIDDETGKTLCYLSSCAKKTEEKNNVEGAKSLGDKFGKLAQSAGIETVVFDRRTRKFHGSVKAFADATREYIKF